MIPNGIEDKYEELSTLQKSATTAVLLVRHNQIGEKRVLKIDYSNHLKTSGILSEANLLSGLKSPGIPIIYDVGQSADCCYLVEEYIEGQSLQEMLLIKTEMSLSYLVRIAIAICEIVEVLHENSDDPILYRDMKPEHVILQEGAVKLIDFGISCRKSEQRNAQCMGSRSYAAPEQLKGQYLDERCDVYGIGRVIEAMSNNCQSKEDIKLKILISRATNSNVDERISSVRELRNELEQLEGNKVYEKFEKKHLNKTIAIIGHDNGIGCSHIGIKLCQYMNELNETACYFDENEGANVKFMERRLGSAKVKKGVLYHKDFIGFMNYGPAMEQFTPPNGYQIRDYGYTEWEPVYADKIIYVISTCSWKTDKELPQWTQDENIVLVANQSEKMEVMKLANKIKKKIIIYPSGGTGFVPTKDEKIALQHIMKELKRC